ncbi:MAG: DNRLRE domain-containing protein, partial [Planctomycetota bacterium]|jgi:hypothetical protein
LLLGVFGLVASISVGTALGHEPECGPDVCIPPDAEIISATLGLYVINPTDETVDVHRIIAPWMENTVTFDNFGGYDPNVEASFDPNSSGPVEVDVTALFLKWFEGTYPNYGLLLRQGQGTPFAQYGSSEADGELRPFLEICFTDSNGETCVVLIRPCSKVADTYIWSRFPFDNFGRERSLLTGFINGGDKETLIRFEFELCEPFGCRFTGGGVGTDTKHVEKGEMVRNGTGNLSAGIDRATFGGQAGASTALPPQPYGEWTHHQQRGPSGRFTFHGGTASAPDGTEIDEIRCSDPEGCRPSGDPPSPVKQLDFDGIGTFKSIGHGNNTPVWEIPDPNVTAEGHGNKEFDGTFHWFEVNIDDLGEPGSHDVPASGCPDIGFGEKGAVELADCDCPDFYRITIYDGVPAADVRLGDGSIDKELLKSLAMSKSVIYEFYDYIDGGNLQIHRLTGKDRN